MSHEKYLIVKLYLSLHFTHPLPLVSKIISILINYRLTDNERKIIFVSVGEFDCNNKNILHPERNQELACFSGNQRTTKIQPPIAEKTGSLKRKLSLNRTVWNSNSSHIIIITRHTIIWPHGYRFTEIVRFPWKIRCIRVAYVQSVYLKRDVGDATEGVPTFIFTHLLGGVRVVI